MKHSTLFYTMILTLLLTTACAKKDLVRQAPPLPPSSTAQALPATPSTTVATTPPVREETADDAAPAGKAPLDEAPAAQAVKSALEIIYFAFDSHTLSGASRERLQENARLLAERPERAVRIEGHTDERGSDSYNLALGEKRARAVMNYLITLGVAGERLSMVSYGEERPAVQGHDEESWGQNRRVEFSPMVER